MADLRIDIASEFVGAKAFKQADTATSRLTKQVSTLAKSYIGLVGAQKLARASVNAAKAFAQDDKAARVLTQSLNNLGLAFADPSVRTFIADLEKQFGVLDDQLRPAFQRLLTTTASITEAQSLLRTALDLSAASGKDVVSVAGDLSKGYVGQTRALAKYGIGLTQVELKAMSFEEVQTRINDLFGGQATVSADTYAGAIQRLAVASNNAQEIIGGGLLDALAALGGGGEGGLSNTLALIEKTSTALATFVRRFGVGVGQLAALARGDLKAFRAIGETEMNRGKDTSGLTPSIKAELAKAAADKAAVKRAKEQAVLTKKQTAAIKEQTGLQKAGTLFDIEQAGIIAALKGKVTDEERKRLELQLAILTGNTSEASKLAGELAKAQGLSTQLSAYLADIPKASNPFSAWASYLDMIEIQARRIAGVQPSAPMTNVPMESLAAVREAAFSLPSSQNSSINVTVNNAGSVISMSELNDQITAALQNASLSGTQVSLARNLGNFR
jgi:hypothetical protein